VRWGLAPDPNGNLNRPSIIPTTSWVRQGGATAIVGRDIVWGRFAFSLNWECVLSDLGGELAIYAFI
jgi:hypothetical protein